MADDFENEGATSQTNMGLAYNPLMPMGDPLAYARVNASPVGTGPPFIRTPGAVPAPISLPGGTSSVPIAPRKGGGDESMPGAGANSLQPQGQQGITDPQSNALMQLMQLRGMADLMGGGTTTTTTTGAYGPTSSGGGGGHGGSGSPSGVSATNAGPYTDLVNAAADKYGDDRKLLMAQLYHESGYDKTIISPAGARGIGQFMPATAGQYGMTVNDKVDERTDPAKNIDAAAHYYSDLKKQFGGNDQLALAAYNWGPGWVQKWLDGKARMPDETRNYVRALTGRDISVPNVPTASATPQAMMLSGMGGQFAIPGQNPDVRQAAASAAAPAKTAAPQPSLQPKVGDMSPYGGPYVSSGGKLYATNKDGTIVPAEVGRSGLGPGEGGRGVTVGSPYGPQKEAPAPTATPAPGSTTTTTTQGQTPFGPGASPEMEKLWKYMLLRSLLPQIQFRNVGYDPWAVHSFGQKGGY